jgi:hypothetical protein
MQVSGVTARNDRQAVSPRGIPGIHGCRESRAGRAPTIIVQRALAAVAFGLLVAGLLLPSFVSAQQPGASPDSDKQTIQLLLKRVAELEGRLSKVESGQTLSKPQTEAQPTAPAEVEAEAAMTRAAGEQMDMGRTLLKIRGFGDVDFRGSNLKGNTTSFSLGQLDLFVTSDMSDKFNLLSEIVFEADSQTNSFGVDVERLLLQYSLNDYFNVAVGRYHTAIGWYNTAYHHSTWLQTALGRPFLFQFEDNGGILPIHNVGLSASGLIPSGRLGLHYVAEIGNGRASRFPGAEAVQNVVDDNNGKAVNLALYAKPDSVRGLQAGFSIYHDHLTPLNQPNIGEIISAAYVVLERPNFEWLNEALDIRHAVEGGHVFNTPGFYTQISKRFGSYRPYFRYQYVNGSDQEPVFPQVGLMHGPSAGLRYDASESVALKLQYDRNWRRHLQSYNSLGAQLAFTF